MVVQLTLDPGPLSRTAISGVALPFLVRCNNVGDSNAKDVSLQAKSSLGTFVGREREDLPLLRAQSSYPWYLGWVPLAAFTGETVVDFESKGGENRFMRKPVGRSVSTAVHIKVVSDPYELFLEKYIPHVEMRKRAAKDLAFLNGVMGQPPGDLRQIAIDKTVTTIDKSYFSKKSMAKEVLVNAVGGALGTVLSNPYPYLFFYLGMRHVFHFAPLDVKEEAVPEDLVSRPGEQARVSVLDETLSAVSLESYQELAKSVRAIAEKTNDETRADRTSFLESEIFATLGPTLQAPFRERISNMAGEGNNFFIDMLSPEVSRAGEPLEVEIRVYYAGGMGEQMCLIGSILPENIDFDIELYDAVMEEKGWQRDEIYPHRWIYPANRYLKIDCDYDETTKEIRLATTWLRPGDVIGFNLSLIGKTRGQYQLGPFTVTTSRKPGREWHSSKVTLLLV